MSLSQSQPTLLIMSLAALFPCVSALLAENDVGLAPTNV